MSAWSWGPGPIYIIEGNQNEEAGNPREDQLPPTGAAVQRCAVGDVWQLGRHRLICGNTLDPKVIATLMNGHKAQMVFTDPPYNVPVDGHVCGSGSIKHREFAMASGEMSEQQFTQFLQTAFENMAAHSVDGAIHFICMDWRHMQELLAAGKATYTEFKNLIVWAKDNGGMGTFYAPLGYDIVEKKLIINPVEAETIRHIFARYLELGGVRQLCDDLRADGIYSKARDSDSRPGGMAFSRGALYHLLSNTLYVGKIRYKDTCHLGQHKGIIDPQLWDQVQQKLVSNRAGIVEQSRKTETGSLNGKLFDAVTGEALVIVHANKKGRRYRYYISQSLKTGTKESAPNSWRLPGQAIEATIFGIARTMLNDRDAIVDALQAASIPSHHIPALLIKAHEVAQYQGHVFDTFLRRVELRHDGVQVQLSLASLVSVESQGDDISINHNTPMQIRRRGHEMRLVIEGGMAAVATIDSTLINAISRAHAWSEALLSGSIGSMAEIASHNNVSDSYVKKIMPLAFLAPNIVEAIMAGRQPAHLTTQMLIRQMDIPLDWQGQHRALRFSA